MRNLKAYSVTDHSTGATYSVQSDSKAWAVYQVAKELGLRLYAEPIFRFTVEIAKKAGK